MKIAVTTLVFCVAALLSLGMVILYSATIAQNSRLLVMQLIWGGVGLFLCICLAAMDEKYLKRLAVPLWLITVALLVLVFVPGFSMVINGARRWLHFGPLNGQPSELAKIALILGVAWYGDRYRRQMPSFWRGLAAPGAFIGLIVGLIFIEPDRGAAILLTTVSGIMLMVSGVRWRYALPLALIAACALAYSLTHDAMRSHRIAGWLNPSEHLDGVSRQGHQAMLALGSGGWTGLGLGNSRQKLGFISEHHTDFILAVVGEELGLAGTLLVVSSYVLIIICGLFITLRASSPFGMLIGTGITFLIGLQAFINIGVVTSTLPNKGLALPFVSYGGSSLVVMLAAVGMLLSVARQVRVSEALPTEAEVEGAFAPQLP